MSFFRTAQQKRRMLNIMFKKALVIVIHNSVLYKIWWGIRLSANTSHELQKISKATHGEFIFQSTALFPWVNSLVLFSSGYYLCRLSRCLSGCSVSRSMELLLHMKMRCKLLLSLLLDMLLLLLSLLLLLLGLLRIMLSLRMKLLWMMLSNYLLV